MSKSVIRIAKPEDAEELLKIYALYVKHTAITFEYEVPTVKEFRDRIEHILKRHPYLVAERDGELIGYAYAGVFNEREACDRSVETAIYVRKDGRKDGIGRMLYVALEKILSEQNILNLNACIAYVNDDDPYLTKNSVEFHKHMGYRFVGRFHRCGYKFGRWYDLVWMEKYIGEHVEKPEEVIWFDDMKYDKMKRRI